MGPKSTKTVLRSTVPCQGAGFCMQENPGEWAWKLNGVGVSQGCEETSHHRRQE